MNNLTRNLRLGISVSALCLGSALGMQARTISGIVTDEKGQPLTGATVREIPSQKGRSIHAVVVDENGHFSLNVEDDSKVGVSYIGYKPFTLTLGKESSYRMQLEPNIGLLDEVVVTGYQTLPKERATGAFAKISSEELQGQNITSVSDMLTGHVAGFNDGKLRGVTSMNGLTTPLYVIDGFPVEKTVDTGLNSWAESVPDLNVEDIESITVLKDAAATSIYGARAANGVVVITTKRAKKGKIDVNFSMGLTYQPYSTYTGHLADAATMIGLEKELAETHPSLKGNSATGAANLLNNASYPSAGFRTILRGMTGELTQQQVDAALASYAAAGYKYYEDMDKYAKKNPFYQQYNLRVGSSTENNSFTSSLSYRNNQFADKYNYDSNVGISLQNTLNVTRWLTFDAGAFINYANGSSQSYSLDMPGFSNFPYMSLGTPENPYTSPTSDRYTQSNVNTINTYGLYNMDLTPLNELGMGLNKKKDLSTRVYGRLVFKFTDWLRFTTQYQYEAAQYNVNQLREEESLYTRNRINIFAAPNATNNGAVFMLPKGNIFNESNNDARAYDFRAQLDFNRTFNEVHHITALAGYEMRENRNAYKRYTFYNYDPDLLTYSMIDEVKLASGKGGLWGGWSDKFTSGDVMLQRYLLNRFLSYYGNAAYDYDGKYMLTGSIRWDRTNLYASGSKYQNKPIWSVGAGWRLDQEGFLKVDWINMLKLRASYGIGGNIAKMSAPYLTTNYGTNSNVGQISGSVSNRPNPNLRWEKTKTFNVGLDFGLLNNRLNGSVEFYNKKGTDLLANTQGVPVEGWGYWTYTINNGEMTNRGVELTLNGIAYSNRDWNWSLNATAGYNHNRVDYVNIIPPMASLRIDQASAFPSIGLPYNALYGYQWGGLNELGQPTAINADGSKSVNTQPSTLDDIVYLGSSVPVFNGSFGSNLRYKNFTLSMLFLLETGHKLRKSNVAWWDGKSSTVSADIANRWMKPGDEATTDIPRFENPEDWSVYGWDAAELYKRSSINVVDADNLRLRNLSVAYDLPTNLTRKAFMQSVRVMAGMENVFMLCANKDAKYMLGGFERPSYVLSVNVNF